MIAIIDYGLGNLSSVKYALDRLGVASTLTSDGREIVAAEAVILPGVGAIGEAMRNFRRMDLVSPAREAAASGRPFLGICLGQQMLFSVSEEHGRHEALDIVPGKVVRFPLGLTVPHMGWNQVAQAGECPLFEGVGDESFFYFAHSYYVVPDDPADAVGLTDYDVRYASVVRRGNVYGTQFHPEKSGKVGKQMLSNFCRLAGVR
jgi:glutamine amidotransferase